MQSFLLGSFAILATHCSGKSCCSWSPTQWYSGTSHCTGRNKPCCLSFKHSTVQCSLYFGYNLNANCSWFCGMWKTLYFLFSRLSKKWSFSVVVEVRRVRFEHRKAYKAFRSAGSSFWAPKEVRRVRLDRKACRRFVEVDRVCFDHRKACRMILKVEGVCLQQRKAYRRLVQVRRVRFVHHNKCRVLVEVWIVRIVNRKASMELVEMRRVRFEGL